jgi:hypothetical protein
MTLSSITVPPLCKFTNHTAVEFLQKQNIMKFMSFRQNINWKDLV